MSRRERDVQERGGRVLVEPEDAMRIVRQIGIGLLVASLFVNWASHRLARLRGRLAALPYRVVPEVGIPGAVLADLGIEILDATSPRSRRPT